MSETSASIGPWEIVRPLGAGGMGVVHLGRRGGTLAAVKTIAEAHRDDVLLRRRFEREATALAAVESPHVAAIVDFDVAAQPAWMATRFVDGPTLYRCVADHGPMEGGELVDTA